MEDREIHTFIKGCLRKKRFKTRGYAQDRADRFGQRAYHCPSCCGFHLTSQVDKKTVEPPANLHYMHPAYAAKLIIKNLFGH